MPHTPAAPPGGKAVVKMPPGMPVAKVGVVDLNSGPFVKAKRQASIDYLSDSDSGESSAPIDAMPKRPPPLKAMPKKTKKNDCLASSVILALSAHFRMFGNTSTHSAGRSFADARQLELCALCEV